MRLLNICVLVLLVAAAAYVYEIKFESTLRAERVAKMRGDVQRERDAIAALRAEWATLENPARIQGWRGVTCRCGRPMRRNSTRSTGCRSGRRRSCSRRPPTRSPTMIDRSPEPGDRQPCPALMGQR